VGIERPHCQRSFVRGFVGSSRYVSILALTKSMWEGFPDEGISLFAYDAI
jgi:hypothetical protein